MTYKSFKALIFFLEATEPRTKAEALNVWRVAPGTPHFAALSVWTEMRQESMS